MAGGKKTPKKPQTNGANTPAIVAEQAKGPPVVIGLSLGDSYASIAVINKVSARRYCRRRGFVDLGRTRLGRTPGVHSQREWGTPDCLCHSV